MTYKAQEYLKPRSLTGISDGEKQQTAGRESERPDAARPGA